MPHQDASKPSRRQILADQRKKYGAYDEVRLAELLPRRFRFQKRSARLHSPRSSFESLVKRDDITSTSAVKDTTPNPDGHPAPLPPAPSNSGAVVNTPAQDGSIALPPAPDTSGAVPASPPTTDDAPKSDESPSSAPPSTASTPDSSTHNDTSPTPLTLSSSPTSSRDDSGNYISHHTIATIAAVITLAVVFIGLGYFFKRYRQKLSSHCTKGSPWKRRQRKKSQRLGSIDGLRAVACRKDRMMGGGEGGGSKDVLLMQLAPTQTAGPFDRAIGNMFPHKDTKEQNGVGEKHGVRMAKGMVPTQPAGPFDRALCSLFSSSQRQTQQMDTRNHQEIAASYLSVSIPPPTLNHQRSLESIVEVQEPPSSVSTQFTQPSHQLGVPDQMGHFDYTPARSDRRPRTSPSTSRNSTLSISDSLRSSQRPATARERDIEMTHTGSHLVIRDRPSATSLRRPLSSAGNSFRSVLRKTRPSEEGEICIETEGITESKRVSWATPATEAGVYELAVPSRVRELRSHFSSSTLRTDAQRGSCVSADSPAGSFSFEIREGVRRCAPVTLSRGPSRLEKRQKEVGGGDETEDDFVRDLDWDLGEYTASNGEVWNTPRSTREAGPSPVTH